MRSDSALRAGDRGRGPYEFSLAAGAVIMVVAAMIAAATCSTGNVTGRLAVMAGVAGAFCAVVQAPLVGGVVTALGYLLFNGFLVNRYGELTWDRLTGPRVVAVFAVAACLGVCAGSVHALATSQPPRIPRAPRSPQDGG